MTIGRGATSTGLAVARRVVAEHQPAAAPGDVQRMAWLSVGAETGRAELRLRAEQAGWSKDDIKAKLDSLSEMSGEDLLMLQSLMEQKSQNEQMISNILRSARKAGQELTANIKA